MWGQMFRTVAARSALAGFFVLVMSSAVQACACCSTFGVRGVSANDVLNIRKWPSARSRKVGQIPAGFCGIQRLGPRRGNWVKINYGKTNGWVHSRYIRWIK